VSKKLKVLTDGVKEVTVSGEARFLPTPDLVNHPPHYNGHPSGVECITVIEHMNLCLGNVIKYIWRADDKGNDIQDLEKAEWYLKREIARRKRMTKTNTTRVVRIRRGR
jgi:hypothetical protein